MDLRQIPEPHFADQEKSRRTFCRGRDCEAYAEPQQKYAEPQQNGQRKA